MIATCCHRTALIPRIIKHKFLKRMDFKTAAYCEGDRKKNNERKTRLYDESWPSRSRHPMNCTKELNNRWQRQWTGKMSRRNFEATNFAPSAMSRVVHAFGRRFVPAMTAITGKRKNTPANEISVVVVFTTVVGVVPVFGDKSECHKRTISVYEADKKNEEREKTEKYTWSLG